MNANAREVTGGIRASTRSAPIPFRGHCTGREDLLVDRYLVFDSDAPVMSGAEVVVVIRRRAGIVIMSKLLQWRASDREWFLAAWSNPADVGDHSRIHAFHFDPATRALRGEIEVLAVLPVVEEIRLPRRTPHLPLVVAPMAPGQLEAFDRESRDVVAEWTRGYPPPRRLEFDNDPQTVLRFCSRKADCIGTAIANSIQSEPPEPPTALTATALPQEIEFKWTLGSFWTLHGIVELWQHTANTPFSSATKIWEGRGSRVVIGFSDTTTRYFWARMRTIAGQLSDEFGVSLNGNGLGAAALKVGTIHIDAGAATDVAAVEVNSDTFNFPNPTGTQDRDFTAVDIVNSSAESYELEVSVTGNRHVTTPAGLSGTTDVIAWISISNITDGGLVASTQDWMSPQLEDVPANTTRSFIESTVFVLTLPAGKTFRLTPKCRVFPQVGSTGVIQLITTAYTLRIATVKR